MDVERIKICQASKYYVSCSKKFKDTTVSSQEEQSCLYDVATFGIAHNKTYKGRSYRMFVEWLIEAHYLRLFLGLSRVPHFTTLQKFTDRIVIILHNSN